jgi:hypothetical protein
MNASDARLAGRCDALHPNEQSASIQRARLMEPSRSPSRTRRPVPPPTRTGLARRPAARRPPGTALPGGLVYHRLIDARLVHLSAPFRGPLSVLAGQLVHLGAEGADLGDQGIAGLGHQGRVLADGPGVPES